MKLNNIDIEIRIKLNSKNKLEILITKQKELAKVIEAISEFLPFFGINIEIEESSNNCYALTGKNNASKFAVLCTIIEGIADLFLELDNAPNFYA